MKKVGLLIFLLMLVPGTLAAVSDCDLSVAMINQDPYPAIPGEYVDLVFQLNGVENSNCGTVTFELVEEYPLIFDPGKTNQVVINAGIYKRDFGSFLIAPFKVRVDEDALDGDNPIEVRYRYGSNLGFESTSFNLNVENVMAEFEIFIKDYDILTNVITFEILNIGGVDIEALTVEIPKQETITLHGAKVNIVGDLDSNEYTTAEFVGTPKDGKINLKLTYTDPVNKRRTVEASVDYEADYFTGQNGNESKPWYFYLIYLIVIGVIVRYFYGRHKKKKHAAKKHALHHTS